MSPEEDEDQKRLFQWVRIFGSIMFMVTLVLAVIAIVLLPVFVDDYSLDVGTVVAVLGTLATSALALVGVELRLRRNGFLNGNGGKRE
jgi:uncharacterized membrane protein YqjE